MLQIWGYLAVTFKISVPTLKKMENVLQRTENLTNLNLKTIKYNN